MGPSATYESGHFYFAQTGHSHFAATPKVENLDAPPVRDENVGGFDVTMNDAFAVSSIERIGNLDGNRHNTLRI
jgi:hypothetical protein